MTHFRSAPIDQIGIIVDNLEAGIDAWMRGFGVGPWTVFHNVTVVGQFRGQATAVSFKVAMGYQDETQIELMEITNEQPSPYRDAQGNLLLGMHHVGWLVDDLDAAMDRDGMKLVFIASSPGTRVAYFEVEHQPGMLFEFIESPATRELMAQGRAATKVWDESNPITIINLAEVVS